MSGLETFAIAIRKHRLTSGTFLGMGTAAMLFAAWEITFNTNRKAGFLMSFLLLHMFMLASDL